MSNFGTLLGKAARKVTPYAIAGTIGFVSSNLVMANEPPRVVELAALPVVAAEVVCINETPTCVSVEQPTATATPAPTMSGTPQATPTQVVLVSPTPAPATPIQTATPVTAGENLFFNPGFEPPFTERAMRKTVAQWWEYFECDGCPAPRQGNGNPVGLKQGGPEFVPSAFKGSGGREWMQGTNGQHWFCFSWSCDAGVYQVVTVSRGSLCTAGAKVRSWSTDTGALTSQLITTDDKANSTWFIRVQFYGSTDWKTAQVSRGFGYTDGIYDAWADISYTFQVPADSIKITVFFENLRLWPFPTNDNYIDAAYLYCNPYPKGD